MSATGPISKLAQGPLPDELREPLEQLLAQGLDDLSLRQLLGMTLSGLAVFALATRSDQLLLTLCPPQALLWRNASGRRLKAEGTMQRGTLLALILVVAGCQKAMSPELLRQYQARTLYTCCNIFYEHEEVSDANYHVGTMLPAGTPVQVQSAGRSSLTILAGSTKLTLVQAYGKEPFQQYIDKILVVEDPKPKLATFPQAVQSAIHGGRIEVGMNKDQVLASVGYPPSHRTASTAANEWLYWRNRWITYKVQFDDGGKVIGLVGINPPTSNQPIVEEKPTAAPAAKVAPAPATKKR